MTDSTNTPETLFSFYRQQSLEASALFLLRCSYLNDCKTYEQYTEGMDKARALRELAAQYRIDKAAIAERAVEEAFDKKTVEKFWTVDMVKSLNHAYLIHGVYAYEMATNRVLFGVFELGYARTPARAQAMVEDYIVKLSDNSKTETTPLQDSSSTSDSNAPLAVLEPGSREIGSVLEISGEQSCRPLADSVPEPFWKQTRGGMAMVFEHGIYELSLFGKRATVNQGIGDMDPVQTLDNIKLEAQRAVEAHEAKQTKEKA